MTFAVYGTSSIAYVEYLRKRLGDTLVNVTKTMRVQEARSTLLRMLENGGKTITDPDGCTLYGLVLAVDNMIAEVQGAAQQNGFDRAFEAAALYCERQAEEWTRFNLTPGSDVVINAYRKTAAMFRSKDDRKNMLARAVARIWPSMRNWSA